MTLIGCLGGNCSSREKCAHYLQGTANEDIRLCQKNQEEPTLIKEIGNAPQPTQSDEATSALSGSRGKFSVSGTVTSL